MAITVYGIPGCDSVRKARAWLRERGIAAGFHDLRKAPVPQPLLERWIAELGAQSLLNRRGTTWRRLDAADQARAEAGAEALAGVFGAHPTLIKRPVIDWNGRLTVGLDPARWPPT